MTPRGVTAKQTLIGPEGIEYVPAATETTPDAVCWIWAAIPPRADGRIDIPRVAKAVNRSDSTIRRWIRQAPTRALDQRAAAILRMRANLRGHGDYLWPPLNPEALDAATQLRQRALWRLDVLGTGEVPGTWDERELMPHTVYLYYHPRARVFGVAASRVGSRAHWAALQRAGAELVDSVDVPTRVHAAVLKYETLDLVNEHRCLPPRAMIPSGRTETWHRRAGDICGSPRIVEGFPMRLPGRGPRCSRS